MDELDRLLLRMRQRLMALLVLESLIVATIWLVGLQVFNFKPLLLAGISLAVAILLNLAITWVGTGRIIQPLRALRQSILHLSPDVQGVPAPDLTQLAVGRELVTNLVAQLNQLASVAQSVAAVTAQESHSLSHNFIAQNLPLPLIILDASDTILFVNNAAAAYLGIAADQLQGSNFYSVVDMAFPSEDTLDAWLAAVRTRSATSSRSWERVKLNVQEDHPARLFDLAAYYNRDNPDKIETMLALFDHTKQYSQEDQAVSFIALTVHELRTPLTLLRGYIEVFEDEFGNTADPELQGFMQKMRAQAEQLTAFVNNILNVARVDDDQLELRLEEGDWSAILKNAINTLSLQAKVRGITLHCRLNTNLPPVGVDRLSIQEVMSNLLDNAIKYSGESKVINIETHLSKDGMIETTVQDFGLGIADNIMPHLFTKFYRDHRNRAQVGGTGLGLYLSKAIVTAHGGNIWVRSKPGEGSTFGFTLVPYAKLTEAQKSGDKEISRTAHGWIKNHSLYRR